MPPCEPIEGDTHRHLLPSLERFATELGYTVTPRQLDGSADGWCDSRYREIVLNSKLAANGQVRVLVHEIAHALGIGYRDYGRQRAEVLVDTVTYIVCGSVGSRHVGLKCSLRCRLGRERRARRDPWVRRDDRHDRTADRRQPLMGRCRSPN